MPWNRRFLLLIQGSSRSDSQLGINLDGQGMNELYTALVIAFVCAGIGFVGYVIGVVKESPNYEISNVGDE